MFLEYFEPQCHPLEKNAPSDWLRRRFAQFSERSRNSQSPTVILLRDFQVHPPATLLMNDPVHRPFGTDIVPYSSLPFPLASLTFFPSLPPWGLAAEPIWFELPALFGHSR